jgi:hypothetical protein
VATKKKRGILTPAAQWWRHLKWAKRKSWKQERREARTEAAFRGIDGSYRRRGSAKLNRLGRPLDRRLTPGSSECRPPIYCGRRAVLDVASDVEGRRHGLGHIG